MSEAVIYQCPNCGAGLSFHADSAEFLCEFCLSHFTKEQLEQTDAAERAQQAEQNAEEFCAQMVEYDCPSCGAQIVCDENTAADFCYYCHNPVVLSGRLSGQKKPDRIIPFAFGAEEAQKKFREFAGKKKFVPRDFSSVEHAKQIQGVYFPFWITDADCDASADAQATRVTSWRQGDYQYTKTSRYHLYRAADVHFEDITSCALSDADAEMMDGVLPYPSEALQEFSMPYLSGYSAKKRDIEREALTESVRSRMNGYAKTLLRDTMNGYATVQMSEPGVKVRNSAWEYSLMPIWILTYPFDGKTYLFAMNGHTGKIYGQLPLSRKKLFGFGGILFAVLTVVLTLLFGGIGGCF